MTTTLNHLAEHNQIAAAPLTSYLETACSQGVLLKKWRFVGQGQSVFRNSPKTQPFSKGLDLYFVLNRTRPDSIRWKANKKMPLQLASRGCACKHREYMVQIPRRIKNNSVSTATLPCIYAAQLNQKGVSRLAVEANQSAGNRIIFAEKCRRTSRSSGHSMERNTWGAEQQDLFAGPTNFDNEIEQEFRTLRRKTPFKIKRVWWRQDGICCPACSRLDRNTRTQPSKCIDIDAILAASDTRVPTTAVG